MKITPKRRPDARGRSRLKAEILEKENADLQAHLSAIEAVLIEARGNFYAPRVRAADVTLAKLIPGRVIRWTGKANRAEGVPDNIDLLCEIAGMSEVVRVSFRLNPHEAAQLCRAIVEFSLTRLNEERHASGTK